MKIEKAVLMERVERFKIAAKKAQVKLTPQRLEIFREVASRMDHPNAESVFRAVNKRMPSVSLDTVYRTLSKLSNLELITTLGPPHESVRYDANLKKHHHYVCMICGQAYDFLSPNLDNLNIPEQVKMLGSISATHVEVRGICKKCTKA